MHDRWIHTNPRKIDGPPVVRNCSTRRGEWMIHQSIIMLIWDMRTTVDLPDELFRRVKSEAALRGKKLKDLVEEGLRAVVDKTPPANEPRQLPSLSPRRSARTI